MFINLINIFQRVLDISLRVIIGLNLIRSRGGTQGMVQLAHAFFWQLMLSSRSLTRCLTMVEYTLQVLPLPRPTSSLTSTNMVSLLKLLHNFLKTVLFY